MIIKRYINKIQMYDGFPSLWFICGNLWTPGRGFDDCFCGMHEMIGRRGWTMRKGD